MKTSPNVGLDDNIRFGYFAAIGLCAYVVGSLALAGLNYLLK